MRSAIALWLLFAGGDYAPSIEKWRAEREERLKSDTGWLTLVGLEWLKPGRNRIALPAEASARYVNVSLNGTSVAVHEKNGARAVKLDEDVLSFGPVSVIAIERAGRYALRIRSTESRYRKEFTGLRWYPIDEKWRVEARFKPYNPPRKMKVPNIIGTAFEEPNPGYAEFVLKGRTIRLDPVLEGDQLFFIFKDTTAGKATYGGGRFLYTDLPKDGRVVLDFNKAYTPPCAFTPYATCPLPPKQNRMTISLEAGELNYVSPAGH